MTASAFSLTLTLENSAFHIIKGTPVLGGLHGPTQHFYCGHCKSWLFTRPEGLEQYVNLRATMLDDASWFEPYVETWTNEQLPWAQTAATHSFATQPEIADYARLTSEYAERGARPTRAH